MGDQLSFVDGYYAGIARWLKYHDVIDIDQFPNCKRLYEQLQNEPAVKFAHAIEQEQPPESIGHFLGHVSLNEVIQQYTNLK